MSTTRSELDVQIREKYNPLYDKLVKVVKRMETVTANLALLTGTAGMIMGDVGFCEEQLQKKTLSPELLSIRLDTITKMSGVVAGAYAQLEVDEAFIHNYYDKKDALLADMRKQIDLLAAVKMIPSDAGYHKQVMNVIEDMYQQTIAGFKKFEGSAPRDLVGYQAVVKRALESSARFQKAQDLSATTDKAAVVSTNNNSHFNHTPANNQPLPAQKKPKKSSGGCNIM